MNISWLAIFCSLSLLISDPASAQNIQENSNRLLNSDSTNDQPAEYFTIEETRPSGFDQPEFIRPQIIVGEFIKKIASLVLTNWVHHTSSPTLPAENYDRKKHFGTWVNPTGDGLCYNTRAQVLIRDSEEPVTLNPNNKCSVIGGKWHDPYTGQIFKSSADIQIDHVVPLKHAFQTGAWKWDFKTRCSYANFMANPKHLMSVSGHENMSKSDKSPDDYMPPNQAYACSYLQTWLKIKLTWKLVIFPGEAEAIQELIKQNNCTAQSLKMDRDDLKKYRDHVADLYSSCDKAVSAN